MNREELKQTLRELIQNDPYIAFFIEFLADMGLEELVGTYISNPKTGTRITTKFPGYKLTITQNGKSLTLSIREAKELVEELYGRIPLILA
jgi:hypothetical protein